MMQFHMHSTHIFNSIKITLTNTLHIIPCVCCRSKNRSKGERQLRRLRANHVKCLRQLGGKASKVASKKHGRNIIQSYTNFDSEVRLYMYVHVHDTRYLTKVIVSKLSWVVLKTTVKDRFSTNCTISSLVSVVFGSTYNVGSTLPPLPFPTCRCMLQ